MFKPAVSHNAYRELAMEIAERPTYELMRKAGVALPAIDAHGGRLLVREEEFMSRLPHKIPGLRIIADFSDRAHSAFLTRMRADAFDELTRRAAKSGVDIANPKFLKDAGRLVNSASGRGPLGNFESASAELAQALFAPKLITARADILFSPITYMKADPFVRKEAMRATLNTVLAGSLLAGMGRLIGQENNVEGNLWSVEGLEDMWDSMTNSDFAKITVGDSNTRLDPYAGYIQYVNLVARLMQGESTSPVTGETKKLGVGGRFRIIGQFFDNKVNPGVRLVDMFWDHWEEDGSMVTDYGDPIDPLRVVENATFMIMLQDVMELWDEDPMLLPLLVPAWFGMGVNTFPSENEGESRLLRPIIHAAEDKLYEFRDTKELQKEGQLGKQPDRLPSDADR
jgi:uncharacterized protein (DUF1330 family)